MSGRKKQPPAPREHKPSPGRRAYVCEGTKDNPCGMRRFMKPGEPAPICAEHGRMKRDPNRPYRGQEIPESAIEPVRSVA